MGLEIIEQVPDVDAVIIPVGGGGLIAGCAVALKTMNPDIKIIVTYFPQACFHFVHVNFFAQGVEPVRSPGFTNALKNGEPVFTPTTASIADGLLVPTVGVNAFATGGM